MHTTTLSGLGRVPVSGSDFPAPDPHIRHGGVWRPSLVNAAAVPDRRDVVPRRDEALR
jgi:hypothetical protein